MIESLENKKVKNWTKLHQKKYRDEEYLLLDEKIINIAYQNGYLKTLIYVEDKPFEFVDAYEVSREVMNKVSKADGLRYIGIGKKIIQKPIFNHCLSVPVCTDYYNGYLFFQRFQIP